MHSLRGAVVLAAALSGIAAGSDLPCQVERVSDSFSGITCPGFHLEYRCTSSSHHTQIREGDWYSAVVWSTRVLGRLADGAVVYDATLDTLDTFEVPDAGLLGPMFEKARAAIRAAAGDAAVSEPRLVSTSDEAVSSRVFSDVVQRSTIVSRIPCYGASLLYQTKETRCVGDLGDLVWPGQPQPSAPCPPTAQTVILRVDPVFSGLDPCRLNASDRCVSTHTHTSEAVYSRLNVSGHHVASVYELVAETAASTLTVPIVLSPTGGSAFTSELTLTNRGATDAQVSYAYTPAFGGAGGTATDTHPAGTQRVIPDAIAYVKTLGVTDPGAGGNLRITFSGLSSVDAASATVRTTATTPDGRAGLAYPGLPPSKLLSSPVFLPGLRQNATDRSNVAVLNAGAPGDGDVTLRLTVVSGDPANPQSKVLPDVTLSPGGFTQVSSILASNGLALSNGSVRVERISGSAPFYAYAVVNDQVTADGSFVEPVAASPATPIALITVPALVETNAYATELVLTNLSSSPRALHFTWVAQGLSAGRVSFDVSLLAGEQQILPAFVQLLRERGAVANPPGPSLAGALFASDDSGDLRGVSIAARITSGAAGGRYGVFLPGFPSGSEATATAWLFGLQQNTETRTNLALVNTGSIDASPSTFRIDLFDGATGAKVGSLVSMVDAKAFVQIDRILAGYAPGTSSGYALVTKTSGSNPFLAYAVLNDGALPGQRSGDGAFVAPARPVP